MPDRSESFILEELRHGNIHALEQIYNRYYPYLCRYLLLLFKNQSLAELIANDIFIYLWEHRQSIKIKSSLESYLYAAGRYKALNKLRDNKRKWETELHLAIDEISVDDPASIVEIGELQQIIERAIGTLPPRCQQIFRLSREEEMSYNEIADFLGLSVNTVEGHMSIALNRLRNMLKPYYSHFLHLL